MRGLALAEKDRSAGDRVALRGADQINRLLGDLNQGCGLVAGGVFRDGAEGVRTRRDFLDVPVAAQRGAGAGA